MEKRTLFTNRTLGIALVVPQVLLIFTFFYWPAGQALYWAFTLERPWGGGNEWVGTSNFTQLLGEEWAGGVEAAVDLALLGRYYERIADHAVTVADRVVFVVTGEAPVSA